MYPVATVAPPPTTQPPHTVPTVPTTKPTVPTTKPPGPPTTQPPPTKPPTTPIPLDKDALLKKAAELDKLAKDEIDKFDKLSRRALVSNIESLDQTILDLAAKIKTTSGVLPLQVLESQLYWLETELGVEIDAIESAYNRIMKMVNDAQVLDARIDKGIAKVGPDTPVGKALKEEKESLAKVVNSLRAATDARTISVLEFDLALIEERVNTELPPGY
ncbi:unnamed protein product [Oppiella nova]|uniref:Uncharacterized protein n=1 Tax=Oppiella nova TaxID=334625 RepID=A0A7R9LHS4_9ACAR|nr:unnamed protein product [Oppiella nova]CAG2163770.1 unnamed protein product [Oppiella nova]